MRLKKKGRESSDEHGEREGNNGDNTGIIFASQASQQYVNEAEENNVLDSQRLQVSGKWTLELL